MGFRSLYCPLKFGKEVIWNESVDLEIILFFFGKCEIRKADPTFNVINGWYKIHFILPCYFRAWLNWNTVFLSIENTKIWLASAKLVVNLHCQKCKQEVTRGWSSVVHSLVPWYYSPHTEFSLLLLIPRLF